MTPKKKIYQLELTLLASPFEVSRTFTLPEDIRLDYLHLALQRIIGWRDSHMHEFQANGKRYGMKML